MNTIIFLAAAALATPSSPSPRAQARVRTPLKRPAAAAKAPRAKPSWPAVELHAVNLRETLHFRPYDVAGRLRKAASSELTRIMRCWHTGKQHKVDPRLGRVLYQVARHYAGHKIEIYSGFRPRAYCTREHSRHLTASAIDFHVEGVRNETVVEWLRGNFHPVGVGYYPNGVHVHLDVDRMHDAYWVDAGDAPTPADQRPALVAVGTGADGVEATGDEPVEVPAPAEPAAAELFEPPSVDPGIPE
jgi:uncharacterized protein YcbK (DUF882 family)